MLSFSPIDRHAEVRIESSKIIDFIGNKDSYAVIWHQGKIITKDKAFCFPIKKLDEFGDCLSKPIYLGRNNNRYYFAYQVKYAQQQLEQFELMDLRAASRLESNEYQIGLLFYAQGLFNWHKTHQYCANCGQKTQIIHSGHARSCSNTDCNKQHFPRIEPAVIFSVINKSDSEEKILLARQASWDENRYSVLAGFVEHGESIEDAVKREGYEEVGLAINNINYIASQPWPFPGSLMIGFTAETNQQEITLIDRELEIANWFTAKQIQQKIENGQLKLPFSVSISWHLIDRWFTQQTGYSLKTII